LGVFVHLRRVFTYFDSLTRYDSFRFNYKLVQAHAQLGTKEVQFAEEKLCDSF